MPPTKFASVKTGQSYLSTPSIEPILHLRIGVVVIKRAFCTVFLNFLHLLLL